MHAHACPCIRGQPHNLRPASGIPSATVCVQKGWFLGLLCCWASGGRAVPGASILRPGKGQMGLNLHASAPQSLHVGSCEGTSGGCY